jgi:hypothetical protein
MFSSFFSPFPSIFFMSFVFPLLVFLSPPFFFLFFFMILPLFFVPFSPPGDGVFIRAGGEGATPPLSSHGKGVGWLGRPLYSHPRAARRACLLCPFHHGGRPWGGVGCVEVFRKVEGRDAAKKGRKRGSYPTPVQSCWRGKVAGAASVQPP